jgi:hypothetical protein
MFCKPLNATTHPRTSRQDTRHHHVRGRSEAVLQNVRSVCNVSGSSSLHTMNEGYATPSRSNSVLEQHTRQPASVCCGACHSQCQCERRHKKRARRTCTRFTPPRVTWSITHSAQRHVALSVTCALQGAATRRGQPIATKPNMTRRVKRGENSRGMTERLRGAWRRGLLSMALVACCRRSLREETRHSLHDMKRPHDVCVLLLGRQRIAGGAESERRRPGPADEVIGP